MHKTYYEHAVAIITAFFLAIQIMITVDQTKINYARLPFTRVQFRTVQAILTDDNYSEAERVAELFARITELESSSDEEDSDGNTSSSTAKKKPKPKRRDPTAFSDDDVENIIKYLNTMEDDDHKRNRLENDNFTTMEYVEYGILKFKNTKEEDEFIRTGIIPTKWITKALSDIDQTIQETVSSKVLQDKRHIRANGKQKTGLEIYQALQTPHDNVIMNCLYLYKKIDELTAEEARIPASYFQKLVLLRQKLDEEMSNLNSKLEKYEILTMLDTVNKFSNTTAGQAAKQALLQRDFASFNDVEEYKSLLMQITKTTN